MSNVDNETFKNCFCDGSCRLNGICGGNREWYGPNLMYPSQIEEIEKAFQTTTTGFKPTKAEELRRKADLAQRDKRAEARAKHDDLYNNYIAPSLTQEASKGKYHLEIYEPQFQVLTKEEFEGFIDYLTDLGFYVDETEDLRRTLFIDWKGHREAPPTTEYLKNPPRRK